MKLALAGAVLLAWCMVSTTISSLWAGACVWALLGRKV
jgi:hypothetical protein